MNENVNAMWLSYIRKSDFFRQISWLGCKKLKETKQLDSSVDLTIIAKWNFDVSQLLNWTLCFNYEVLKQLNIAPNLQNSCLFQSQTTTPCYHVCWSFDQWQMALLS